MAAIVGVVSLLFVVVPAGAQEASPGDFVNPPHEGVPPGTYSGSLSTWVRVSGFTAQGVSASYEGVWQGPAEYVVADDGTGSGTWSAENWGNMTFEGRANGNAVFAVSESGALEGGNVGFLMSGSSDGTVTYHIDGDSQTVSLNESTVGPWEVLSNRLDCNLWWMLYSPSLVVAGEAAGWTSGVLQGEYWLTRIDEGDSAEFENLRQQTAEVERQIDAEMQNVFDVAQSGEQPNMSTLDASLASAERIMADLGSMADCPRPGDKEASWRSAISQITLQNLTGLLSLSPGDITYTGETLNAIATVGARAGVVGQGKAAADSQAFTAALQTAAGDAPASTPDQKASLNRLDARLSLGQ